MSEATTASWGRGRRLLVAVAALTMAGITASLGFWQLSRAAQKQAIHARIEQQRARPALDNAGYAALSDPLAEVHRPARLSGTWLPEHTVFLDNRSLQGRPGFYVMTPLALDSPAAGVLWVQRGWAPRDLARPDQLPPVQTPGGRVDIGGRLAAAPSRMFELGASRPGDAADAGQSETTKPRMAAGSSPIRQNLDTEAYAREHRWDARPGVLLQTGDPSDGLRRDWPEIASGVDKHYGYAFQWFGLSALVIALYVWFQIIVPRRRRT